MYNRAEARTHRVIISYIAMIRASLSHDFGQDRENREGYILDPYVIFLPTRNIVNKVTINIHFRYLLYCPRLPAIDACVRHLMITSY